MAKRGPIFNHMKVFLQYIKSKHLYLTCQKLRSRFTQLEILKAKVSFKIQFCEIQTSCRWRTISWSRFPPPFFCRVWYSKSSSQPSRSNAFIPFASLLPTGLHATLMATCVICMSNSQFILALLMTDVKGKIHQQQLLVMHLIFLGRFVVFGCVFFQLSRYTWVSPLKLIYGCVLIRTLYLCAASHIQNIQCMKNWS